MNIRFVLCVVSLAFFAAALPQVPEDPNADDYECLSSFHEYDTSVAEWTSWTTTTRFTEEYVETSMDSDVPFTTLCDGRARALEPYKTILSTSTSTLDPPEAVTEFVDYTGAAPTCTIAETACTPIRSAWESSYSEYVSNDGPYPTGQPHCTTGPSPRIDCGANPGYCFIYGGHQAKLFFWPVTTVSGDFCAQNGTTVTPTPTDPNGAPNTGVVDGITFTSPTNYFSMEYAEAFVHFRRPTRSACGPPGRENVLVPLTGQFSSTRGSQGGFGEHSFNYADLATPVPASAWDGQRRCNTYAQTGACPTIMVRYVPQVLVPTQIINLEPEWVSAGCIGTATPLQIHTYVNLENGQTVLPPESRITDPPEIAFDAGTDLDFPV